MIKSLIRINLLLASSLLLWMVLSFIYGGPDVDIKTGGLNSIEHNYTSKKLYSEDVRLNIGSSSFCSGVVISSNYVLTAAHCIVDYMGFLSKEQILVEENSGLYLGKPSKAVAIDNLRDVGLIEGDFSMFNVAKVDFDGTFVKTDMTVTACGFPSGQYKKYCTNVKISDNEWFRYKAKGLPIYKGMSGGPVYDPVSGYVIGVNSAVSIDRVIIGPLVGLLDTWGLY